MEKKMDRQIDTQTFKWMHRQSHRGIRDKRTDGGKKDRTHKQTEYGQIGTDGRMGGQTEGGTNKKTYRWTDK